MSRLARLRSCREPLGYLFKAKGNIGARCYRISSALNSSSGEQVINGDIIYKQEHMQLRQSLRKIIDQEINPHVDEWEAQGQFPAHKVFKTLGSAGFLGVNKPTASCYINGCLESKEEIKKMSEEIIKRCYTGLHVEYGGLGLDFSYSMAVAEELGHINCGGVPMAIGVQTDMATPALANFGSDKMKRIFLAPTIAGDMVACLGVSEVGSGSDVASIQTKAVRKGDEYVINGGKMWITSGCQADWMCLLANTSDGQHHQNKSLICLPMDAKGITIAKKIDKMGMRSSDTAQIFFEDVKIPADHIIGEEGAGFMYQMIQFQLERLWGTAAALLPMDKLIAETVEYTRQRKAFGQPILNNQVVHFTLAELQTEVEALRSMLYRAVALYVEGNDVTKMASMCKLKVGRLARQVTDSCLQFWGGMGFTNEVLVSRFYRDFRLLSIGAGADEVMLSIICKYMNMLPQASGKKKK